MIILVTGSRSFNDKDLMVEVFNQFEQDIELIIHGGASGADRLAEEYAIENDINSKVVRPVKNYLPTYYLHRNAEMVAMCDMVVAFWDGVSRGTQFTIDYAKARAKTVKVVPFSGVNDVD